MAESLSGSQQVFLQSFLSRGILDARDVKELYGKVCERFNEEYVIEHLADFVIAINSSLKPFGMEIKKATSEDFGSQFYGLVNTSESSITKMCPTFNTNELELFKKIIESIVVTDEGYISTVDVLNLSAELDKKMTKTQAEEFLRNIGYSKWIKNVNGRITLDTRTLIELDQYMKKHFSDHVVMCNMCQRICIQGQACVQCDVKIHFHCATRYFYNKENPHCPEKNCKAPWTHEIRPPKKKNPSESPSKALQEHPASQRSSRKRKA